MKKIESNNNGAHSPPKVEKTVHAIHEQHGLVQQGAQPIIKPNVALPTDKDLQNAMPAQNLASTADDMKIDIDESKHHHNHHSKTEDQKTVDINNTDDTNANANSGAEKPSKGEETLLSLAELQSLDKAASADPIEDDGSSFIANGFGSLDIVEDSRYDWTKSDVDFTKRLEELPLGSILTVEHSIPSIEPNPGPTPQLVVADRDFSVDAKASFASLFTANFGNDGFKDSDNNGIPDSDAIQYTLGVSNEGDPSGLVDTFTNEPVLLYLNGNQMVEGRIGGPQGELVFSISIDAITGEVILNQIRSVVHDDVNDPNETFASGSSAGLSVPGLVTVTLTIIDKNLNAVSSTKEVGDAFHFEDDGPSITLNDPNAQETSYNLVTDDTNIIDHAGPVSFASLFTFDFGNDGPKDADNNDDTGTIPDPDAITYKLIINEQSNDTGLRDTLTNDPILLFLEGNNVVGRAGSDAGPVVFTIYLNTANGEVSLEQNRSIVHDDPSDPFETADSGSAADLPADLIKLQANIIDGDYDHVAGSQNIGQFFKFEDDEPDIELIAGEYPSLVIQQPSTFPNAGVFSNEISLGGMFSSDYGKDGFKDTNNDDIADVDAIKYQLSLANPNNNDSGLIDKATGEHIYLFEGSNGSLVGKVGGETGAIALTLNVDGNGDVSSILLRPLNVNGPDSIGVPINLIATITDGDGDTDSASTPIALQIEFVEGVPPPPVIPIGKEIPTLVVDDTNIFTTNSDTKSFIKFFGNSINFGPDGPKDVDNNNIPDADAVVYSLTTKTPNIPIDSGLIDTLTNQKIYLYLESGEVVGRLETSLTEAFRITVITVDFDRADVTLQQSRSIVHDDPSDSLELAGDFNAQAFANNNLVKLVVTITDGTLSSVSFPLDIGSAFRFEDDGPRIDPNQAIAPTLTVDDTNIPDGSGPVSFAGLFDHDFGKDGPKDSDNNDDTGTIPDVDAIKYKLDITSLDSGLLDSLSGQAIKLHLEAGGVIVGRTELGNDEVFRISINENTADVTLTQSRPLMHTNDQDIALSNNLITITATITDGDYDTASAVRDIGGSFVFKDDQPVAVDDCHECDLNENEVIPEAWSVHISFIDTNAGYNNSFGYYIMDSSGNPLTGQIIWEGVKDDVVNGDFVLNQDILPNVNPCNIGFFIIPDGYNKNIGNSAYNDNSVVNFEFVSGHWQAYTGSGETKVVISGQDANIFFDNAAINVDNYTHFNYVGGDPFLNPNHYHWEDLVNGGDADFNDVEVSIQKDFECDPCGHPNSIMIGNLLTNDDLSVDAVNRVYSIRFSDNVEHLVPVNGVYQSIQNDFVLLLNSDGSYTFNLINPLPAGETVFFEYRIIDSDGSLSNWADFCFDVTLRNVPSIVMIAGNPEDIVVDETVLANNKTVDYSDNFTVTADFGPDGPGTLFPVTYALSTPGGDSGLKDTLTGNAVLLKMDGGNVVGYYNDGINDIPVFVVSVDAAGKVTLDQIRSIIHPDSTNSDEAKTLTGSDPASLVVLTATETIVDSTNDSKTVSASINIGTSLIFHDDAPSFVENNSTVNPLVVADRDFVTDAKASFASLFTPNFGADGPKDLNHDGVADLDAVQYTLGLNIDPGHNDSGVKDTQSGLEVYLFLEAGEVVGRAGDSNGEIVFVISVDANSGEVTLDQRRAVVHDDPSDPVETGNSAVALSSADLINITMTLTDGDGDKDSATRNIGDAFRFEDGGPSITANASTIPTLTDSDANYSFDDMKSFAGLFNAPVYGNDGPNATNPLVYSLVLNSSTSGITDTVSGQSVVLSLSADGKTIFGKTATSGIEVFKIILDNSGNITLDQSRAVVHGNPLDPIESATPVGLSAGVISLKAVATDGDGDSKSASRDISDAFKFTDAGPSITVNASTIPTLTDSDANYSFDDMKSFAGLFNAPVYGNDGPNATNPLVYSLVLNSSTSGITDTVSGQSVVLSLSADGKTIFGKTAISGLEVFKIILDNSGNITLDQSRAVVHGNPLDPIESATPVGLSAGVISLKAVATDGDGDSKSANRDISDAFKFTDAGPSIVANNSTLPTLTTDDTNTPTSVSGPVSFAGAFNAAAYGADGPAASNALKYTLVLDKAASGLTDTLTGQAVMLSISVDGLTITGKTAIGGDPVLIVKIVNATTGTIELDQIRSVVQTNTSSANESRGFESGVMSLKVVVTDGDGDSAPATRDISGNFLFKDDGPSIVLSSATIPTLTVDDTTLATNDMKSFASLFTPTPGADGYKDVDHNGIADADAIKYTLGINTGSSGLIDELTGSPVVLSLSGGVVYGKVGSAEVFKISVDANTGMVTLDQSRPIVHTNNADKSFANVNLVTLTATVTDGDLDTASVTKNIGGAFVFQDDQPIANEDCTIFDPNTPPPTPTTWEIKINYVGTNAGYNNSFGYYVKDPITGDPLYGKIIWEGVQDSTANAPYTLNQSILPGVNPYNIGYFIVPDGYTRNTSNSAYNDNASVTFVQNGAGDWQAKTGATFVNGYGQGVTNTTNIFFDNANLNIDNYTHYNFIGQGTPNSVNYYFWEDIYNGGDADFNDVEVTVQTSFAADPTNPMNTILTGNLLTNDDLSEDLPNRVYKIRFSESDNVGINIPANTVYQNNEHGFVLLLNADGSFTFNLTSPIATGDTVFFQYQLIDGDGSVSNWADFCIDYLPRNVPTLSIVGGAPDQLVVDETVLATNAQSDFSNNFTITKDYGPDGAGSTSAVTYTLSISANAQDTGLKDVETGKAVLLKLISGTVYGYYNNGTSDVTVFTVAVNAAGTVTLDQIRALVHPNASDPDDSITLSGTNASSFIKLTATQTITDSNGDQATGSGTINLGTALNFEDEGPAFTNKNDANSNNIVQISANNPNDVNATSADVTHTVQLIDWDYKADGAGSISLNSSSGSGSVTVLSSTVSQIVLQVKEGSTVVGLVTLNQSGNDTIDLYHRSNIIDQEFLSTGSAKAGGPGVYYVDIPSVPNQTIEISSARSVNPSTQGWAVGNNLIEYGESIKFASIIKNSTTPVPLSNFTFYIDSFSASQTSFDLTIKVKYSGITTPETLGKLGVTSGEVVDVMNLNNFNPGAKIEYIEITNLDSDKKGGFRINGVNTFTETSTPPPDLDYTFNLKLLDKDSDSVFQNFTLHIDGEKPLASPGYAVDGPIAGATIFQDIDTDAIHDLAEAFTISNHVGAYMITLVDYNLDGVMDLHDGRLVSMGGIDIETGLKYNIPLFAPIGSEIISPLTSILTMQMGEGINTGMVNQALAEGLGFMPDVNLASVNPMSAAHEGDLSGLEHAAAIMTLSVELSEAFAAKMGMSQASVADEVYKAIGDQVLSLSKGAVADFTNSDFLHSIIDDASHQLGLNSSDFEPIMNLLVESQVAIHNAAHSVLPIEDGVALISATQHYTQGEYAQVISEYYSGHLSEAQLGELTEALHQYNQMGNTSISGETPLTVTEMVSGMPQADDTSVSHTAATADTSTANTTPIATEETTSVPTQGGSIESTSVDHPPQPYSLS